MRGIESGDFRPGWIRRDVKIVRLFIRKMHAQFERGDFPNSAASLQARYLRSQVILRPKQGGAFIHQVCNPFSLRQRRDVAPDVEQ